MWNETVREMVVQTVTIACLTVGRADCIGGLVFWCPTNECGVAFHKVRFLRLRFATTAANMLLKLDTPAGRQWARRSLVCEVVILKAGRSRVPFPMWQVKSKAIPVTGRGGL
jgi:hypothetical protein